MSKFHRLFSLSIGFFALMICMSAAQASLQVVISSAPAAKEVFRPPQGHAKCRVIPKGFYNGVWQEQHRVCHYTGRNRGHWVSGYWKCLNFKPYNGVCGRWSWVPSHWENQRVVAYAPPPPPRVIAYGPSPRPTTVIRVAPPVYHH